MPQNTRHRAQLDSPASDPVPVADVLRESPIAKILAAHEVKSRIEPERPMPEPDTDGSEAALAFKRQREREQAVIDPATLTHAARVRRMQPAPPGFIPVKNYPTAGMRVNKSFDRKTVAIQFDEARHASREGLVNEVETLQIEGLGFEPLRRQWEREDRADPGGNIINAVRLADDLAVKRVGREIG